MARPHSKVWLKNKEVTAAIGRPMKYGQVPVDHYIKALQHQGVSEDIQWLLHDLFTVVFDGRNSHVMPGVENKQGQIAVECHRQARVAFTLFAQVKKGAFVAIIPGISVNIRL